MDKVGPGQLGSTFGGNPTACAAALATLDVILEEGLLERARKIGTVLMGRLRDLQLEFAQLGDVRGLGAMIGLEFVTSAEDKTPNKEAVQAIVANARESGLILLPTGTYGNVIRLLPPIRMSDAELEEGMEGLEAAIRRALEPVTATV
jgi:4-aminobutyrate aminotransferase/(S)-3-amino-2-methylpropionate transaminase